MLRYEYLANAFVMHLLIPLDRAKLLLIKYVYLCRIGNIYDH